MSDFLSNFNKDKYKDLVDEEKDGTDDTKKTETRAIQSEGATQDPTDLDSREEIASAEVSSSRSDVRFDRGYSHRYNLPKEKRE
ncbi:MAG: hypothetical protein LRY71_00055 [Bacillaceae bacterium]|nr:hypothetical protein [Bacillaceae bacterium]